MKFLSDRLWPKIQPALKTAREVLVTTWNIEPEVLLALAEAAPKACIRLVIDGQSAPSPFSPETYGKVRDRLGDRVKIRKNKGPRVLHAKVLIIRGLSDIAIVGSSNLTKSGLGCAKKGNIEASVLFEPGPEFDGIVRWFSDEVWDDAIPYIQPPKELLRYAFPFSDGAQGRIDEEEQEGQEKEPAKSWDGTLPTAISNIKGLAQRVLKGMNERLHPLRNYQHAVLHYLDQQGRNGAFRELVVLPVGAGKTRVAAEFIARRFSEATEATRPMGILWVAHTLQLVEQAASAVLTRLCVNGDPVPTVLLWVGGAKSEEVAEQLRRTDPCIAFATVQSLPSLRNALGGRTFDLVVVDEAHHIGAPKWGTGIREACRSKTGCLLGLTATPDRLDDGKLGFKVPYHYGGVTFRTLVEQGILAIPKYQTIQTKGGQITDLRYAHNEAAARKNFENGIGTFDKDWRNSFIAKDLVQRDSGQTLVFCATKDHADNLQRELIEVGLPEDRVRSVHSGRTINERADALEWFRAPGSESRFLLNCKLYIEGFDMTDVCTVVLARPTLSPTYWVQMIGRGVRRSKVHPSFDIIEYTDNYEEKRWSALRASFYLLHDEGSQWWRKIREEWPNSTKPRQINSWNKKTHDIYSKMLTII